MPRFDFAVAADIRDAFLQAVHDEFPASIDIARTFPPTEDTITSGISTLGLTLVLRQATAAVFLAYFERYNEWLDENLGTDAHVNWPMTLNFARVVRNAASHGKINIRNPRAPPVTWRGLAYAQADNGKQDFGEDLYTGDIIQLMLQTGDELDALGVPILYT